MAAMKELLIEYMVKRRTIARETFNAHDLAICEIALEGEPARNTLDMLNAWDAVDIREDYYRHGYWSVERAQQTLADDLFDELEELKAKEGAAVDDGEGCGGDAVLDRNVR